MLCIFNFRFILFLVVIQSYVTDVFREQVIMGNDVLLKCHIPSFVADFVTVESWVDSEEFIYHHTSALSQGKHKERAQI